MDRLFHFFPQSQSESIMPIRFSALADYSVLYIPEYSGLLMSCQTVDWVCRGVVVSSGPSPLASLSVSEQGFGFLVCGGGQRLRLSAPRLGQAICSFISHNPTVGWDPL